MYRGAKNNQTSWVYLWIGCCMISCSTINLACGYHSSMNKYICSTRIRLAYIQDKLEGRSVEHIPPHRPWPLTLTFQQIQSRRPLWPRVWLTKFGDDRTWIGARKLFCGISCQPLKTLTVRGVWLTCRQRYHVSCSLAAELVTNCTDVTLVSVSVLMSSGGFR